MNSIPTICAAHEPTGRTIPYLTPILACDGTITNFTCCGFTCRKSLDIGDLLRSELMAGSSVTSEETASSREGCESKPDEKFTFHFDLCFGLVIIFYDLSGQFELNVRFLFEKD